MSEALQLQKSNCKNCYKCIRHCPVKSIRFADGQANIISNECVLCGQCVVVCPQHAKQIHNDTAKVKAMINTGRPVIASLAPSFIANYKGAGIDSMRKALKELGFFDVEETAIGATMVKNSYERIMREENRDILITSCCHSVNLMIQKHFPSLLPYLADVLSPMQAHCQDIKKRYPDAYTVFIGPCLAKKDEATMYPGIVDAAITFDELSAWMKGCEVVPEKEKDSNPESRARFFPTPGGVMKTMTEFLPQYTYMAVDGMENLVEVFQDILKGDVHNCFIEANACFGSCIGGPAIESESRLPVTDYLYVARYAGQKDFPVEQPAPVAMHKDFEVIPRRLHQPTEQQIQAALHKMGKMSKTDELNCGCCGYNSCREKAIAVCQGKAQTSMCLPYLMTKAESLSDNVVSHNPSGIMVLNENFEVQLANIPMAEILNLSSVSELTGHDIFEFLDPSPFMEAMETEQIVREDALYLELYNKYVNMTVVYGSDTHQILVIMSNVTAKVLEHQKKEEKDQETVRIADQVIEKQMRIVQEIAFLLGETTAETKIALTKLKETLGDEQ